MRLYITYNREGDGCITGEIEKAYVDSDCGIPCLCVVFKDYSIEKLSFSEYEFDSRSEQCAKALKWVYQQFELDESGIVELHEGMHFVGKIAGVVKAIDEDGEKLARLAKKNAMVEFD